jgi:phenylpropionate dioxygenase-like ring-hydroxylating dioxygenase large terminal subunit
MDRFEGAARVVEDGAGDAVDRAGAAAPQLGNAPIDGSRYHSPEFARREWDAVWTRAWLIGGLESDMPEPGDFLTVELGPESILFVRGEDGWARAFYNVCQHRGNRLV